MRTVCICREHPANSLYTFEVWGAQLLDFIEQKIGQPTFLLTNSVGGDRVHLQTPIFVCHLPLPCLGFAAGLVLRGDNDGKGQCC